MDKMEKDNREYYTIDILHLAKALWRRAWIIVICGILAAGIGFSTSAFMIAPTYSSSVKLYVNNSSFSLGNSSFSLSQLTAAQSLVKTYSEILKTRTTLERVIEEAEVDYTPNYLMGMIKCESTNETEIMRVTVTCKDPYEASKIANTIAEVLPGRISEIIDGASMEVVDSAIPNFAKVAPNITRHTAVGLILGVFASVAVLVILALMDDTIHDEDYILKTYDFPILGKVPDLLNSGSSSYRYYYSRKHQKKNN